MTSVACFEVDGADAQGIIISGGLVERGKKNANPIRAMDRAH